MTWRVRLPRNYQHEEYEQDGQGGYDHGDGHGAPQVEHEEKYEGKNQERNNMYRKSEMNQSKYTPYKHGGKPAITVAQPISKTGHTGTSRGQIQ